MLEDFQAVKRRRTIRYWASRDRSAGRSTSPEHVGYDPAVIHGTLQTEANQVKHIQRPATVNEPTFATEFHTYAMEWPAEKILMEIDGMVYGTFDNKAGDGVAQWPFDKPFYLILNLAIGGDWGGAKGIDDAAFPLRMEVDFVRVC